MQNTCRSEVWSLIGICISQNDYWFQSMQKCDSVEDNRSSSSLLVVLALIGAERQHLNGLIVSFHIHCHHPNTSTVRFSRLDLWEFMCLLSCRWVQIACPRLSIDWGSAFSKPLLSPYEVKMTHSLFPSTCLAACGSFKAHTGRAAMLLDAKLCHFGA